MSDTKVRPPATDEPEHPAPRESLLWPIVIPVVILVAIVFVLWAFSRALLQMEPMAATASALLVAIGIMTIVSFAAGRKRLTDGSLVPVVLGVFGVGMVASGLAITLSAEEGGAGPEPISIAIAAPAGAATTGFDLTELSAPADQPFTIAFSNQDPGIQHNVAIASADPIAEPSAQIFLDGQVVTGPFNIDYEVEPLTEAEYFYYCRIHPTTMTGTLTVTAGAAPGAPSGPVITAANTAFDSDVLTLAPDVPTTLTFNNDDAGVAHNVAIYTDESASEVIFQGEIITGVATATYQIPPIPAGSYFFRCDIHPSMNGTVTVEEPAGGGGGGAGSPGPSPTGSPPGG
jgi:plastocyanin